LEGLFPDSGNLEIPEIFLARKSLIRDILDSRLGMGSLINIFNSVGEWSNKKFFF
jgi:hypothetical protein